MSTGPVVEDSEEETALERRLRLARQLAERDEELLLAALSARREVDRRLDYVDDIRSGALARCPKNIVFPPSRDLRNQAQRKQHKAKETAAVAAAEPVPVPMVVEVPPSVEPAPAPPRRAFLADLKKLAQARRTVTT